MEIAFETHPPLMKTEDGINTNENIIPKIENSSRSWNNLLVIDTISNKTARFLLLAFKIFGLLFCGLWMNVANCDKIPPTLKSGLFDFYMIICAICIFHFCVVCIVSRTETGFLTFILTLLLTFFEGVYLWVILAYIERMERPLLCRKEREIMTFHPNFKSNWTNYPIGCSDCDIIEATQRGKIPTNCTFFDP